MTSNHEGYRFISRLTTLGLRASWFYNHIQSSLSKLCIYSHYDIVCFHVILKNSLTIHEENTRKITTVSVVLYVIKFHVNLHKL